MTATTTTLDTRRGGVTIGLLRRAARGMGTILSAIGAGWNDFVDSGQLGPSAGSRTPGPTGTWI